MNLKIWKHKILAETCRKLSYKEIIETDFNSITDLMEEVMYTYNGIGLAANQVGLNTRFFIMKHNNEVITCINPVLIKGTKGIYSREGCLSVPGSILKIPRFDQVAFNYVDTKGKEQNLVVEDTEAVCVQHEIDHLAGLTIADRVSSIKHDSIKRKIKIVTRRNKNLYNKKFYLQESNND